MAEPTETEQAHQALYDQAIGLSEAFLAQAFARFRRHQELLANHLTPYEQISLPAQHTFNVYVLLVHCLDFSNRDLQALLNSRSSGYLVKNYQRINFLDLPSDKATRIKLAEIVSRNFGLACKASDMEFKVEVLTARRVTSRCRHSKHSAQNLQAVNLVKFLTLFKIKKDLGLDLACALPPDDDQPLPEIVDRKIKHFQGVRKRQEEYKKFLVDSYRLQKFEIDEVSAEVGVDLEQAEFLDFLPESLEILKAEIGAEVAEINGKVEALTADAKRCREIVESLNAKIAQAKLSISSVSLESEKVERDEEEVEAVDFSEVVRSNIERFKTLVIKFDKFLEEINESLAVKCRQPIAGDDRQALWKIERDLDTKLHSNLSLI